MCLSVCLYVSVSLPACLSPCLFVCQSVSLSVSLSVCLCLSVCLSVFPSLSVSLSVSLLVCVCLNLPACTHAWISACMFWDCPHYRFSLNLKRLSRSAAPLLSLFTVSANPDGGGPPLLRAPRPLHADKASNIQAPSTCMQACMQELIRSSAGGLAPRQQSASRPAPIDRRSKT